MSQSQDKKVRKITKGVTDDIKFRAIDLLNGIKEAWPRSEKRRFAAWLQDPGAGEWGDEYKAPITGIQKLLAAAFVLGLVVSQIVSWVLAILVFNA